MSAMISCLASVSVSVPWLLVACDCLLLLTVSNYYDFILNEQINKSPSSQQERSNKESVDDTQYNTQYHRPTTNFCFTYPYHRHCIVVVVVVVVIIISET